MNAVESGAYVRDPKQLAPTSESLLMQRPHYGNEGTRNLYPDG